jgi:hypothetical protein
MCRRRYAYPTVTSVCMYIHTYSVHTCLGMGRKRCSAAVGLCCRTMLGISPHLHSTVHYRIRTTEVRMFVP